MLWSHQELGVSQFFACVDEGYQKIALTSPTGMGKTRIVATITRRYVESDRRVLLYTGRPGMMLDQLGRDMNAEGLDYSVRAAGKSVTREFAGLTIASLPTDKARSKLSTAGLGRYDLVIVDEGHLHCQGSEDLRVLNYHVGTGAVVLMVTATPVGMGGFAQKLIVAGTVSDGFACGALVRARHFGPDEPALATMQERITHAMTETQSKSAIMRPGVFGRVQQWFDKLNRSHRPTILFAPGVKESRWFAQKFFEAGITAASIDGTEVWINGEVVDRKLGREEVARGSEDGSIQVVCNRFVLREGVNWPWLAHCIFATVFDSMASYLQAGGRILRAHPTLKTVCIQDHGGNWRRHGSLNEAREWSLDFGSKALSRIRENAYRDPDAPPMMREPLTCPRCACVVIRPPCTACGHDWPVSVRTREVVQVDGTLVRIKGSMFPPRRTNLRPDTVDKWRQVYYSMRNCKKPKTFSAAYRYFVHKYFYYPPKNLPLMPTSQWNWERFIRTVPTHELVPDPLYASGRTATRKPRKPKPKTRSLFDEE